MFCIIFTLDFFSICTVATIQEKEKEDTTEEQKGQTSFAATQYTNRLRISDLTSNILPAESIIVTIWFLWSAIS